MNCIMRVQKNFINKTLANRVKWEVLRLAALFYHFRKILKLGKKIMKKGTAISS